MSQGTVVNMFGYPVPGLGSSKQYKSKADARRDLHCKVTIVVAREEKSPGVFRDVTELVHRPGEGTYDGAKCAAVECPNLAKCASAAEPIAAE